MNDIFGSLDTNQNFTLFGVGYLDEVARHPVTDMLDITVAQLHEYITERAIIAQVKRDVALSTYNIDLLNEAEQGFFDFFRKVGEAIKLFFNKIWVNIVSIFKSRVEYVKKYEEQIKSGYNDEKTAVITTIDPNKLNKFKATIEGVDIEVTGSAVIKLKIPTDINGYSAKDINKKPVTELVLDFANKEDFEDKMRIAKEVNTAISEYYQELDWEEFELNLSLDDITAAMNSIKSQPKFIADVDKSIKVYSSMAKMGEKYAKDAEKAITESKSITNFDYVLLEADADVELAAAKEKEKALKTQDTEIKKSMGASMGNDDAGKDIANKKSAEGKSQINNNKYKIVRYLQTMVNLQSMVLKRQVDVLKKSNDKYWELVRAAHKEYLNKRSKNEVE